MGSYRVYFIDEHEHVRAAEDIECDGDNAAIEAASRYDSTTVELWKIDRFLCRFEPMPAPTS